MYRWGMNGTPERDHQVERTCQRGIKSEHGMAYLKHPKCDMIEINIVTSPTASQGEPEYQLDGTNG